jgi:zinc protease
MGGGAFKRHLGKRGLLQSEKMKLDRTKGPACAPIKQLVFPHTAPLITTGGRKAWLYPTGGIGVAKLYLIYPLGYRITQEPWMMKAAGQLMLSGNESYKARVIQEELETIGATIDVHIDARYHQVVISAGSEHISEALEIWLKHSSSVAFPQQEVDVYVSAAVSDLQMRQTTPRYWSQRRLMEAMCGKQHHLGRFSEVADVQLINSDSLKSYSKWFSGGAPGFIILCGDASAQHLGDLGTALGAPLFDLSIPEDVPQPQEQLIWNTHVEHTNQASISWGLPGIQISGEDYYAFWVLNTLLGGFFGSRLMKNIREEKGLTYGIHSSLVNHGIDYHWYISSEVKAGNVAQVNDEIRKELLKLSSEYATSEELEKVKRYLCGNLKMSFDGAFSMASKRRDLILWGRSESFYDEAIARIAATSPESLKELAGNFLKPESFYVSVAGVTQ